MATDGKVAIAGSHRPSPNAGGKALVDRKVVAFLRHGGPDPLSANTRPPTGTALVRAFVAERLQPCRSPLPRAPLRDFHHIALFFVQKIRFYKNR